jgi:hypothetical protein
MTSIVGPPYSPFTKGRTMKRVQTDFTYSSGTGIREAGRGKSQRLVVPKVITAGIFIFTAQAQGPRSPNLLSPPASTRFANEEIHPVDTFNLKAKGLRPNTVFTVYLAKDVFGEIATNEDGRGTMRARANVEGRTLRKNRPRSALMLVSASSDDVCFTPAYGEAEFDVLNPRNFPYGRSASATTTVITARSIKGDGLVFHSIDWRSIPCESTF